jgi:hypothetical protein
MYTRYMLHAIIVNGISIKGSICDYSKLLIKLKSITFVDLFQR